MIILNNNNIGRKNRQKRPKIRRKTAENSPKSARKVRKSVQKVCKKCVQIFAKTAAEHCKIRGRILQKNTHSPIQITNTVRAI